MQRLNRRTFVAAGAAASFYIGGSRLSGAAPKPGATVETALGKVRGLSVNGVNAFRGMRYGASTDGVRRFMPPVKPASWTGVTEAFEYGDEAPQAHPHTEIPEVRATIPEHPVSEDCLRINVWSRQLGAGRRLPVMVWLHGGGFTSGNGGYTIYDGANLARKRDVVMVTINHRLNTFGFTYLGGLGGDAAGGSNVGMLDVVAALQWVRDNIGQFGGDPNNVTIFGQSGGGAKVSTLLAMPSAKGLFHRAIFQSGSNVTGVTQADAVKSTEIFLAKLGAKSLADLQKLPMQQLIEATRTTQGLRTSPVVDGSTLPGNPFSPGAPGISANVPVLCGTTETEVTFFPNQAIDPIDDAQLLARVKAAVNVKDPQAKELIDLYKKGRPGVSNIDVALIVESDTRFRAGVVTQAELKSAQAAAVYMYYFTWRSPVREGKLKAFHTLEIPFVTENVDEGQSMTGAGKDRYALQDKMSAAWTAFARTGNPNHKGLPAWPKFELKDRATMILANECHAVNDPNGAERKALTALRAV
ncbi:MAG: carboxylesterase family protein [Acidobacteriota bacterium]